MIQLTRVVYIYQQPMNKDDQRAEEIIYLNPNHIAHMEQIHYSKHNETVTEISWGAGSYGDHATVAETPEDIIRLIKSWLSSPITSS